MRHAAVPFAAKMLTIDQISYNVGYQSRSSFSRAFRIFYGNDPAEYRATVLNLTNPHQERRVGERLCFKAQALQKNGEFSFRLPACPSMRDDGITMEKHDE
jgi:AraC-like DNA-binding protein